MSLSHEERNAAPSLGRLPDGGLASMVPELDVTDLDVSLKFWCGLLGFSIAYSRMDAGFVYLQRGSVHLMLCELNDEWDVGALERPFGRGVNFLIAVEAVEPLADAIERSGLSLYRPIEEKRYRIGDGWYLCKEFLVQDPDGYLLRFSAKL